LLTFLSAVNYSVSTYAFIQRQNLMTKALVTLLTCFCLSNDRKQSCSWI